MAKVLAIDLDGTLFYPKGRKRLVSKKNTNFLRKFIDAGNKVVLVSSRGEQIILSVINEIQRPIDYISYTGAKIVIDGKPVKDIAMENIKLKEILDNIYYQYSPIAYILSCEHQPLNLAVYVKAGKIIEFLYKFWYKLAFGIYREDFIVDKNKFKENLKNGRVYSVKAFFGLGKKANKANKELNKIIREKYPDIESSWMGIALEFAPKECTKGDSVKVYVNYINADYNDVYVIGDSGNDISMFNAFYDHSFVMSHAYPSVKKYAKNKVSRVYKMDKYLFERRKDE